MAQHELDEGFPDIHELFRFYATTYFQPEGSLGACSVHWSSSRMTLCAAIPPSL